MKLSGWGNNIKVNSNILYPRNNNEIIKILQEKKINNILCRIRKKLWNNNLNLNINFLTKIQKKIKIDKKKKFLICTANISISEIYELLIKNGFYLNITPGSKNVTIGGAIAMMFVEKSSHRWILFKICWRNSDYYSKGVEVLLFKENKELLKLLVKLV